MRKRLLAVFLLVLMIVSLTACGGGKSSTAVPKKVLTIAATVDPGTADPQMTTEEYLMPLNVFDRLVEAVSIEPGKSELVPGLAEKWDISPDGKVYTFHLRKGVKFHNGEELTAEDVVYTFDRMLNPATKALNTDFLSMIAGADERMEGKADHTSGLKVIDKYTVEITLKGPFAPFLANIATPAGSIFNKKATEAAGQDFGLHPVGTGPFKLKEWKYNDQIVLEAFPDYFRGKAPLDQLVVKIVPDPETQRMLFETGKLDVFDLDNARSQIPYFRDNPKWKDHIVSGPRVGTYYYALNQAIPPLDNVKVRQAIQYAINRELLLEKLYYNTGVPAKGVLAPGLAGYNPDLPGFPYDPEKAKQLLKEAGYENGFELEIWQISDRPSTLKMNEAVQAMLGEIGIKVTIKQVDSATWFGVRKEGKLPMYLSDWSADFNDPDNFLYTFFGADNAKHRSFNYERAEVKDALEKCRVITDQNERFRLYQEVEKMAVYEDAAWVPLFHLNHLFVVQPRVKNFKVSWNGWSNMPFYGIDIQE